MHSLSEEEALQCVGAGWDPLIKRLYAAKPEDVDVVQVKEKFGGLRFYTTPANTEFDRLIDDAEGDSYITCEWCGRPGTLDNRR